MDVECDSVDAKRIASCTQKKENFLSYRDPEKEVRAMESGCSSLSSDEDNDIEPNAADTNFHFRPTLLSTVSFKAYGIETNPINKDPCVLYKVERYTIPPQFYEKEIIKKNWWEDVSDLRTVKFPHTTYLRVNWKKGTRANSFMNIPVQQQVAINYWIGGEGVQLMREKPVNPEKPRRPDMATYRKRLNSFQTWPGLQNPAEMSRAGFFFLQRQDATMCFSCGIVLKFWEETDCPYREHARHRRSECSHLKQVSSLDFL